MSEAGRVANQERLPTETHKAASDLGVRQGGLVTVPSMQQCSEVDGGFTFSLVREANAQRKPRDTCFMCDRREPPSDKGIDYPTEKSIMVMVGGVCRRLMGIIPEHNPTPSRPKGSRWKANAGPGTTFGARFELMEEGMSTALWVSAGRKDVQCV